MPRETQVVKPGGNAMQKINSDIDSRIMLPKLLAQ